ncbi:hypothetical protein [Roseivivax marinus]|uniref:hypothetical protein n=1 Tax=Roseivivax marinus TaxID=1379903 RepID=UPI00273FD593|nr:hypothetical protein [Roseivivax marinus]
MAKIDDKLEAELKAVGDKPADTVASTIKKKYSESVSNAAARAFADELRRKGMTEARPAPPGLLDSSGAERRMAGGIGAKKVDVTWSTEESGLLLGISIKSINFRDGRSGNFQKNLTNRRGDMLFEGVTLHRRFPYAVLGGIFFLDREAANDQTARRKSTFENAHNRLKLFTGRSDPAGRDEQYEQLYLVLLEASSTSVNVEAFRVGEPKTPIPLETLLDELMQLTAQRNPDFYDFSSGRFIKLPH